MYSYYLLGSSGFELRKIKIGNIDLGDRNCEREDRKLRTLKGCLTVYCKMRLFLLWQQHPKPWIAAKIAFWYSVNFSILFRIVLFFYITPESDANTGSVQCFLTGKTSWNVWKWVIDLCVIWGVLFQFPSHLLVGLININNTNKFFKGISCLKF